MKKWHCFSHVDALFLKKISAGEWFGLRAGEQFVGCGHCWSSWRQNVPTLSIISHLPCDNIHISAHVDSMNILQHEVLSDCTCGSHEYITASSAFRLHMCIPWIYDSSKWFPTALVHPMNILLQQMISYWTCTSHEYITALSVFLLHIYIP